MTTQLSNTISALRTLLCFLIVFLHMHTTALTPQELAIGEYPVYNHIATFITLISRLAVPLFFVISGYLYFIAFSPTFECYKKKTRKRIRRLFQPVLIWTTLYLLLYLIAQQNPYTGTLFSGNHKPVADFNWLDLLNAYTGIINMPFAEQYWFLRNLLVLCLLSPLLWCSFKYTGWVGLLLVGLIWYFGPDQYQASLLMTSVFFFYLGGYMGYSHYDMLFSGRTKTVICIIFMISLFLTYLVFAGTASYRYAYNLYILAGIPFLFILHFGLIKKGYGRRLIALSSGSYFCFLLHLQILMFLKRGIYKLVDPHNGLTITAIYFITPIICISICYCLYGYLQKRHRKILKFLTGE